MIYKGNDIDVRSGDVVLCRSELVPYNPLRYVSLAIREVTGVNYNHAKVVVGNWNKLMLNEAKAFGVIARPIEDSLNQYKTKIAILRPKAPIIERDFCIRANSKLGVPYDYRNLFIDQIQFRETGVWKGLTGVESEKKMECAEYVAWCHGLPEAWKYSIRELLLSNYFNVIYEEVPIVINRYKWKP